MILLDVNILLYGVDTASPFHPHARQWLDEMFAKRVQLGIPFTAYLGFLRISTGRSVLKKPLSLQDAFTMMDEHFSQSNVMMVYPTESHVPIFQHIAKEAQVTADEIPDAHLAALAIEHNAQLCTHDRGFRRFKGLKIIDPIKSH